MNVVNSTYNIFCVYKNLINTVKTLEENNILTNVYGFQNCNETLLIKLKTIYNDIENNYYNYDDLIIYILYNLIFNTNGSFIYKGNNCEKLKEVLKLFTKRRLEEDQSLLIEVNKKMKLQPNPMVELFKIREDGFSFIYKLIKQKKISPLFYMMYVSKILNDDKNNNDELKHDNLKQFEFTINLLKKYLKGNYYEQI